MRVKCVRIINEQTGEELPKNCWLTLGRVYQVLAVFVADCSLPKYRLLGDDGKTPALHASSQFEVVSGFLPPSWKANSVPYKFFELAPEVWSSPGFWESYFDGDPSAKAAFSENCRKIIEEEELNMRSHGVPGSKSKIDRI